MFLFQIFRHESKFRKFIWPAWIHVYFIITCFLLQFSIFVFGFRELARVVRFPPLGCFPSSQESIVLWGPLGCADSSGLGDRSCLPFSPALALVSGAAGGISKESIHVAHTLVGVLDGVVGFLDVLIGDVGPHPGDLALAAQLFERRALRDQPAWKALVTESVFLLARSLISSSSGRRTALNSKSRSSGTAPRADMAIMGSSLS